MSDDALDGTLAPRENVRLFGHASAERFLATAYRNRRIHHAVLIEGPEGIGKATLAFRFAQHVLSRPRPEEAPDNLADPDPESAVFRQVAGRASHDLLHIARPVDEKTGRVKSAITVDEVRRAGRFLHQTSGSGGWRIVIVDPADDLHRSAANAILKMLEEPPPKALFLVISHAPGRLLPTIRSRCLTLRLEPLQPTETFEALSALPVSSMHSEAVLRSVAERAEGSVRGAVMMLNYGGLDLIEAFEAIMLEKGDAGAKARHALADSLAARDREDAYGFFCDYALGWIARQARLAGEAGDGVVAVRRAEAAEKAAQDLATADAYNLDRKQTVLSLLSSLASTMRPWP